LVVRGLPPNRGTGNIGSMSDQASSLKSVS
jgi:hypothetical protein